MEDRTGKVWNQTIEPKPEGIRAPASIVRANMKRGIRTFVNVNNHYEGSALRTVGRLLEVLSGCVRYRSDCSPSPRTMRR